jgi:lysyl-tRNA synthetase class 2
MLDERGLRLRAALLRNTRSFFDSQGFIEVDTPIRQPVCIPESNILLQSAGRQFLQASPELCMKRLLAAGCREIYQICHCFRPGEKGRLHLEEFQMLEWYRQDADYHRLMHDCEELLRFLLAGFTTAAADTERGKDFFPGVDLSARWERLTVEQAFSRYSQVSLQQAVNSDCFEEVLVEQVEPHLGFDVPLFLYDYPLALGSLARRKTSDPNFVERFELYIKGIELANGFTELTDAREQRERFRKEIDSIRSMRDVQMEMPELFLADLQRLENGAGIALGLDRLFMVATGVEDIARAVAFSPDELVWESNSYQ